MAMHGRTAWVGIAMLWASIATAASGDGGAEMAPAWERFLSTANYADVLDSYGVLGRFPEDGRPDAAACAQQAAALERARSVNPFSPALQGLIESCLEYTGAVADLRSERERGRRLRAFLMHDQRGTAADRPIAIAAEADATALIRQLQGEPLYGRYMVGAPSGSLPFVAIYFDAAAKQERQLHFDFLRVWQRLQSRNADERYPAMLRGLTERYLSESERAGNTTAELAKSTLELGRGEIKPIEAAQRIEALALAGSPAAAFELLPLCLIIDDGGRCAANAVDLVRPHAERDLAEAMIVLALAADRKVAGAGSRRDGEVWLQRAIARAGEAEALTAFAQLAVSVESRARISSAAARALRQAASLGHAPATLLLVQMLRGDRIRRLRGESADRWLHRAVAAGAPAAMAQLGLEYLRLSRYQDAWPLLERAAQADDPSALGLLAIAHDSGKLGIAAEPVRALDLYRRAADLGNSGAMRRLGRAYARAELGLPADTARAEAWYLSASLFGNQKAASELAELYLNGTEGVVGQPSDGYAVIERLAAEGLVSARLRMAVALLLGQGVDANQDLALRMLNELSARGVDTADFRLGQIYEFGQGGVSVDLITARRYYATAAKAGNLLAMDYYARALYAGRGGDRNRTRAVYWWQKAAAKDHAPAVANLAWVRCSSSDPQVRDPVAGTRLVSSALERRRSANLNDTLAACLAASELYVQAVAVQRETLTLAASEANLDDAQRRAFAERLAQYQRGQPWREPD